ncbi:MAG: dihydroorotase, partial [Clostridia bacterium]|nr:dihydroorotase [Clostridia bacterium]
AVCSMPNLNPVPDSVENLGKQLEIIEKDACIHVYPYGSITVGQMGEELSDMEGMAKDVIAFSDDGRGVQSDEMMRQAMLKAKALGKMIVAHCEVNELLKGGYIHDGEYARAHGHKGICSESEWKQIERDLKLVEETGCSYHVCHISTKESVEIIRQAKKRGVDVTCETGPHYLILCDEDLQEEGRFKMNPPLRSAEDRAALIEGIKDGTIDMIATDHAPHSAEEKGKGLAGSMMGVVGIETAFPLLYTYLVSEGVITLEKLIELMAVNPRKRFGIGGGTDEGESADFTVVDLDAEYTIDSGDFYSMGKATPFEGFRVKGKIIHTYIKGEKVI